MVVCGTCKAAHHADCWDDNHGCAVVGCAAGPSPSHANGAPPSPVVGGTHPPAAPTPPTWAPTPPPPPTPVAAAQAYAPTRRPRDRRWLVALALLLILAVAGAGTAVFLMLHGSKTRVVRVGQPPPQPPPQPSTNGLLPNASQEQMRSDIEAVLKQHHEDIVNGDYQGAWNLLSQRKQQQELQQHGYGGWQQNQATLSPYLDPSGIHVEIQSLDSSTGVATVMVTGMKWNKPGANCTEWSGITWAKYENGAWRYDPGYSTTPERQQQWQSRDSELLGATC